MKKVWAKIIRGLIVVLAQLPLKFHYFMGDILSWLAKNVIKYRVGTVWMNVSRAFPELKYYQLKKIVNDYYRHFGEIIAEAVWFGGSSYQRLNKQGIVKVVNPEVLDQMFLNSPSVTALFTHCGNWEILGGLLGYMCADGYQTCIKERDITVVYKKLTSEISDMVFAENRVAPLIGSYPDTEIESMNILRYAIRQRNDIGTFLNQHTYAMIGSVGLASKLSHALVYMKMKSVRRGYYEMEFIPICDDASKHSPDDLILKYYQLLEDEIKETPHNWLWSHNRWKLK